MTSNYQDRVFGEIRQIKGRINQGASLEDIAMWLEELAEEVRNEHRESLPKHCCGAQGFGLGYDDVCEACEAQK